jgi:putative acetyltransferase
MSASLVVTVETPLQSEVAVLLDQSDLVAARLYPGEYRRPINAQSLAQPGTSVLVARLAGKAVGLCVLFDRRDHTIELKRMIVDAEARGQGVGAALLQGAIAEARRLEAAAVLLEVGVRNTEAQALYRGAGFTDREPFTPYKASPISLFMERSV